MHTILTIHDGVAVFERNGLINHAFNIDSIKDIETLDNRIDALMSHHWFTNDCVIKSLSM